MRIITLTFGSGWGWLSIMFGAVSLTNLGAMYFDVGIGPLLERILATYNAIVHVGIFERLFFWLPWKTPSWAIDGIAFYLVVGGAAMRGMKWILQQYPLRYKWKKLLGYFLFWPYQLCRHFLSTLWARSNSSMELAVEEERRKKLLWEEKWDMLSWSRKIGQGVKVYSDH